MRPGDEIVATLVLLCYKYLSWLEIASAAGIGEVDGRVRARIRGRDGLLLA